MTTLRILVLNAGSSTLKYQVLETGSGHETLVAKGIADRVEDFGSAVRQVMADVGHVAGVGHRVVHGGERFFESAVIDAEVEKAIEDCCVLAPLHNPHNLACYRAAHAVLPNVTHVAVFDTAFFHTLPRHAFLYAVPFEYYQRDHVRRYGFHGTSHRYISGKAAEILGIAPEELKLITCHLGNGCSVCAVDGGRAVDISMGMTPLEGLVMGTRGGDVDPGVICFLARTYGLTLSEVEQLLNRKSGLLGLSGRSNDMRDLVEAAAAGDERAAMAVEVFCYRVKKYIGAYWAVLGGADAIVFSGGIGENSPEVRRRICDGLNGFGAEVLVVPTNEELLIARDTARLISGRGSAWKPR